MADEPTPAQAREALARAARQAGLDLSQDELDALVPFVRDQDGHLEALRRIEVDTNVEPDAVFAPGAGTGR